jgi:hypothetical protein
VEAVVWGIFSSVKDFYQTGGVLLSIQEVNNNLKKFPTSCKREATQQQKTTTIYLSKLQLS